MSNYAAENILDVVKRYKDKILMAKEILDTNFDSYFCIKDLSKKVLLNQAYLKAGFKFMTGRSIKKYWLDVRIKKAKELLKEHKLTSTDIAYQLGFNQPSHFNDAFKKATGILPSRY